MSSVQVGLWVFAAVLLFWTVGAYNRLVDLRNTIVKNFTPLDHELALRHELIAEHVAAVGAGLAQAGERLEALRAANAQTDAARLYAKTHPGAPGAIKSLRLADAILAEARARLPVQSVTGADLSELNARLSANDAALGFARSVFNAAVVDYNCAIAQIPTRLIAAVFNFAPAGTL